MGVRRAWPARAGTAIVMSAEARQQRAANQRPGARPPVTARKAVGKAINRMEASEMKGKLAMSAASWLRKPENREKVKRTVREFRSRIARDEGAQQTQPSSPEPGSTPDSSSRQQGSDPARGATAERESSQKPDPPRSEGGDSAGHGRPQS